MAIHSFRPLTPSGRFTSLNKREGLAKERPLRSLTEPMNKTGGRNVYGRVTSRHRGGGRDPAHPRPAADPAPARGLTRGGRFGRPR